VEEFAFANPGLAQTVNRLLDGLKRSAEDDDLYSVVYGGLKRYSRQGQINGQCVAFIHDQLSRFAKDPVSLPRTRIKARLIQQHLSVFLPEAASRVDSVRSASAPRHDPIGVATVASRPAAPVRPAPVTPAPASVVTPSPAARVVSPATTNATVRPASPAPAAPRPAAAPVTPPPAATVTARPAPAPAATAVATENLAERRVRYEVLKRSEQDAWKAIYETINDFTRLKELWVSNLDEMARDRETLSQQITTTAERLQNVETETQSMRGEIEKLRVAVAKRPVVRALPKSIGRQSKRALSKREQFIRSLDAEIERVRRHGSPLALALLDIDGLADIRRDHGDAVAEAVQRVYADEILTSFRAYDVVAFYDENAFAVIFPNTTREGAVRALEKARKRAADSHYLCEGTSRPVPGFAAGLAIYVPGESSDALLARTGHALGGARAEGAPPVVVA
jgi:diguanylate cyclase (GGDEF)-like protein